MRAGALALVLAFSACGLTDPGAWCEKTYHFTVTDSLINLPDSVDWQLAADSVTTVHGIECVYR